MTGSKLDLLLYCTTGNSSVLLRVINRLLDKCCWWDDLRIYIGEAGSGMIFFFFKLPLNLIRRSFATSETMPKHYRASLMRSLQLFFEISSFWIVAVVFYDSISQSEMSRLPSITWVTSLEDTVIKDAKFGTLAAWPGPRSDLVRPLIRSSSAALALAAIDRCMQRVFAMDTFTAGKVRLFIERYSTTRYDRFSGRYSTETFLVSCLPLGSLFSSSDAISTGICSTVWWI